MNIRLVVDNTAPRLTDEELDDELFDFDEEINQTPTGHWRDWPESDIRAMSRWFGR